MPCVGLGHAPGPFGDLVIFALDPFFAGNSWHHMSFRFSQPDAFESPGRPTRRLSSRRQSRPLAARLTMRFVVYT